MKHYLVPIDEIADALETAGIGTLRDVPAWQDLDGPTIYGILQGFGSLAEDVVWPSDVVGDREGAVFDGSTGTVRIPEPMVTAYRKYVEGGWPALTADPDSGGEGLPKAIGAVVTEIFSSANLALALNPILTQGAIELLDKWGSDWQRRHVLTRLVDGSWTGTMNLTEPDAGTDLGAIRTVARPIDGDTWALSGTKIFITWGTHELTENIAHLVLARTPDAPPGTRGLSVFLVSRRLLDSEGGVGAPNRVYCRSIEHKLGIHGSPTCVMEFDDAVGTLVGPLHGGMAAMFSMMNAARLGIGMTGVAMTERSYQQGLQYARERRQGRIPGRGEPVPIIEHPDVQRMLLDMASTRDACRLVAYTTAVAADRARTHPSHEIREQALRRVELLTPVAKAWPTDQGVRVASLALQVHGGMGFVEETGVAQRYRDARIGPIYEGTNGVQAIDLVTRKVAADGGLALRELLTEIETTVEGAAGMDGLADLSLQLREASANLEEMTQWILETAGSQRDAVLAGAVPFLDLVAVTVAAHLLARHAIRLSTEQDGQRAARALVRARFFAAHHLAQRPTASAVTFGSIPWRAGIDM